ncbi:MAG: flippase, partial [Phototrophicaceae bacterium]
SKGMTSLYYAFERAEYPAAVATVTSVSKAILQVAALLLGFGMIGLAAVSIFNNVLTLAILAYAGRDMIGRPALRVEVAKIRTMAFESFPLMLNHFLATIFFQIDVVILEALLGAAIVGKYSVGYRWLLALNIIPAYFTTALFPRLSQQAMTDRAALKRGYQLALKLLAFLVFPAAVLLTALAYPLTILLGGQAFMPEGALALQVIAWSMPIGWLNSLTQYVLIALNRQRALTWAFAAGVTFNITANLIFIPIYGYLTAAVTTILSEALLLAGFMWILRADVRGVNPLAVLLKPALAAAAMAACIWLGSGVNLALGALLGVIVYPLVWWGLRPLNGEERALIGRLLPQRSKAVIY